MDEKLSFKSPNNGQFYDGGDTIFTTSNYITGDKERIVVQKSTETTERYRLRKYKNGKPIEPAEYYNNGQVFNNIIISNEVLNDSEYDIELIER